METEVIEGQLIADKYRIERVIGHGGMGYVMAAQHLALGDRVAIKFLWPEALQNAEAVARFEREALAAARIKSEHVVRVFDVGRLDSGAPYMVMDYLEGEDLETWLEQEGMFPVEQAVDFVLQACVAVAEAHSLGIVHRDLKPGNLFCVQRSDDELIIKVMDFGVSKLSEDVRIPGLLRMSVTKTDVVLGSPLYMAPEQVKNAKDVDARCDIWGIGVVLFELLTGRVPFGGDSFGEVAINIATEPVPALSSYRADVPTGLQEVIARCLQKDRRQRYPDVAMLARALLPYASAQGVSLAERIGRILGTTHDTARKVLADTGSQRSEAHSAPGAWESVLEVAAPHSGAPLESSSSVPILAKWYSNEKLSARRSAIRTVAVFALTFAVIGAVAWSGTPYADTARGRQQLSGGDVSSLASPAIDRALADPVVSPVVPSSSAANVSISARPSVARRSKAGMRNPAQGRQVGTAALGSVVGAVATAPIAPSEGSAATPPAPPQPGEDLHKTLGPPELRALDEVDPYPQQRGGD